MPHNGKRKPDPKAMKRAEAKASGLASFFGLKTGKITKRKKKIQSTLVKGLKNGG